MQLHSDSFVHGSPIPGDFAFGVPDDQTHMAFGVNRNPHLAWSGAPVGTRSFALLCHDGDVPTRPDDVNVEGRTVPADLPRADFFHWILVDIPPDSTEIGAGDFAAGVVAGGKDATCRFGRQGRNDYTGWFSGDPDMGGDYHGYDGPCPPWNDSIVHHYSFTVYALDVDHLAVGAGFTGPEVRDAVAGHVLDSATLVGTYSLNPAVPA
jgi:Raf kinase inhibitor-like YbhB/YbcL family protein